MPYTTTKEFIKSCLQIEQEIWKDCIDESGNSKPIIDGIVDIDSYVKVHPKILWILKEPYDEVENGIPAGGGWSLTQDVLGRDDFYSRIRRTQSTWHPIIYVCTGLLNNFCDYGAMDYIHDNPGMVKILKSIAVINVKKLPGLTRTHSFNPIAEAYNTNKAILLKQIQTYDPDILIGASTMPLFYDDLGIDRKKIAKYGSINYVTKDSKIYIDAYHPAQTTITRSQYVNDIIYIVKKINNLVQN
jgi:hypothetical protein